MKRNILLATLIALISLLATSVMAQDNDPGSDPAAEPVQPGPGHGICQFIDEDGDGFNDLAPDDDGDGIPNGLDPDYVRPEDGSGHHRSWGFLFDVFGHGFGAVVFEKHESEHMFGPGDDSHHGCGPTDGTGFGPGSGASPGDGVSHGNGHGRRGGHH